MAPYPASISAAIQAVATNHAYHLRAHSWDGGHR